VVGFESVAVRVAEGGGEFVRGVLEIVLDGLGGEVKTATVYMSAPVWMTHISVLRKTDRVSHRRPSAAVCFFVLSSLMTRDCNVSDSPGAAN